MTSEKFNFCENKYEDGTQLNDSVGSVRVDIDASYPTSCAELDFTGGPERLAREGDLRAAQEAWE